MLVTISPEAIAMGIEFQEDFEPRHQGGIARGTLLSDSLLQEAGLWLPAGGGSPGAA